MIPIKVRSAILTWIKAWLRPSLHSGAKQEVNMSFLARLILAVAGAIAAVFIAREAPSLGILQAFVGMLLIVAVVGALALRR